MSNCMDCGKLIEDDYDLKVVERFKETDVWIYMFCGWRCLVKRLVKQGMISVEIRGVSREEARSYD